MTNANVEKNHQVDFICRRAGQSASWHVGEWPAADLCTELNPECLFLWLNTRVFTTPVQSVSPLARPTDR